MQKGNRAEAERYSRRALEAWDEVAPDSAETITVLNNLGVINLESGQYPEALSCFERAFRIAEVSPLVDGHARAIILANVATLHLVVQGPTKAEPLFRDALTSAETSLGPQHPLVAQVLSRYAVLLDRTGRKAEARQYRRKAKVILAVASKDDATLHTIDQGELLKRAGKGGDRHQ